MSTKSGDRFRHRLAFTVLGFGAVCVVLTTLMLLTGPRIRKIEVDTKKVVTKAGGRIVLRANQPLENVNKNQVTLEPAAGFSVSTAGDAVVIQLEQKLQYSTDYQIKITALTAKDRGKARDVVYGFRTADATLYYVRRHSDDRPDQILTRSLQNAKETVMFQANKIKEFILLDGRIVAATSDGQSDKLHAIALDSKDVTPLSLPDQGSVRQLRSSPDGKDFGYLFTANDTYLTQLRIYHEDVKASFVIKGPDKNLLRVSDWHFAPDGVAALADSSVFGALLVDTSGKEQPIPLGTLPQLFGFSATGAKILTRDKQTLATVDARTHAKQTIPNPQVDNSEALTIAAQFLSNRDDILRLAQTYKGAAVIQHVLVASRVLYSSPLSSGRFISAGMSPEDSYTHLEIAPPEARFDGYSGNPKPESVKTEILNTGNGQTMATIQGFGLIWN